ncbi:MAG TPA: ABC transporter permease subunit [Thermoanaerobaculia bacterium]|nr:ABC transporter permease subunit [Thermoanaerobaculia bacterium]
MGGWQARGPSPSCASAPKSLKAASRRCSSRSLDRRSLRALFSLEWRELAASRSWWLLLALTGLLVGQAFVTAVETYAEVSGVAGGPAALAQGLSPLDGLVVPTLGAYALVVTFLLPFVAIRLVATERESGAAKLLAQAPPGLAWRLAAKAGVLLLGWLVAFLPALFALLLWHGYGGHLGWGETANVVLGHLLHALLTIGVAVAAAAVCRSSASAAIVTLGFTVGTWALAFVAEGREGLLARLAPFTPEAALRSFERGELRLAVVAIVLLASLAGFAFAGLWLDPFRSLASRLVRSGALVLLAVGGAALASSWRAGWDLSEDRRSSFPRADEAALRRIAQPVRVTVYLAPEDPKRTDLETNVLTKLRRVVPDLAVTYRARSRSGLFDAESRYGEIWYAVGPRRALLRSTTEPIVLAKLYELAGVAPPAATAEAPYPGYPLAASPRGAAILFYAAWPLAAGLAFAASRGRWRSSCRKLIGSPPSL